MGRCSQAKPAEGGQFSLRFKSDNFGIHEAYLKLSSRGAADQYILFSVLYSETTAVDNIHSTGISCWTDNNTVNIEAENIYAVYVYDQVGRIVASKAPQSGHAAFALPKSGTYILKIHTASGVVTRKVLM